MIRHCDLEGQLVIAFERLLDRRFGLSCPEVEGGSICQTGKAVVLCQCWLQGRRVASDDLLLRHHPMNCETVLEHA